MTKVDVQYPTVHDDDGIELVEDKTTEPFETKRGHFAEFSHDSRVLKNRATTRAGKKILTADFVANSNIERMASAVSPQKTQNTEYGMTSAELFNADISMMCREVGLNRIIRGRLKRQL
jgi:hypothetical protein